MPDASTWWPELVRATPFVTVFGRVTLSGASAELLRRGTQIGGRHRGVERAEEFGRRNAVPGELLVRITPERIVGQRGVAA